MASKTNKLHEDILEVRCDSAFSVHPEKEIRIVISSLILIIINEEVKEEIEECIRGSNCHHPALIPFST